MNYAYLIAQAGFGAPALVQLLIICVVVGAILYLASLATNYMGAPPILMRFVYVIITVVVCIYAIRVLATLL